MDKRVREILRYMRWRGEGEPDSVTLGLASDALHAVASVERRSAAVGRFPIERGTDGTLRIGAMVTRSSDLAWYLRDCSAAYLLVATIGAAVDRLYRGAVARSGGETLAAQAAGAEAVERYVDELCADLATRDPVLTARYSPGFGDFGLEHQPGLFASLDATRRTGVSLTDAWLMVPSKGRNSRAELHSLRIVA